MMQVNCSELILVVDNDNVAKGLLVRALELARMIDAVAFVTARRVVTDFSGLDIEPYDPIYLERIPHVDYGDVCFVETRDAIKLVLTRVALDLIPEKYRVRVDPDRLAEACVGICYPPGCYPYFSLFYDRIHGHALYYWQHHQPQLYPILTQLSYEFHVPIKSFDGGTVADLRKWLRKNKIAYSEPDVGTLVVMENVIGESEKHR